MVATHSTMLPLGTRAPDFSLEDPNGRRFTLGNFKDYAGLLVVFMCNHCPYVKHLRQELARLTSEYTERGVGCVGINANDSENYPADSPAKMIEEVRTAGYRFPYLFDATQEVAKAYKAACTPDFYVFDSERRLFYRGQFDDSRPGNGVPITGQDLRGALDAMLSGKLPPLTQKPSVGCNIKWRPGSEPDYF